jgi:hypothetical protein
LHDCDNAAGNKARGDALEALCRYLFEAIPDVDYLAKNILDVRKAHELDLAFLAAARRLLVAGFESPLFLECKNFQKRVGTAHVAWFATKLQSRGARAGVLVSLSGITGQGTNNSSVQQILDSMTAHSVRIVVLTRSDISSLVSTDDLENLLQSKMLRLITAREVIH